MAEEEQKLDEKVIKKFYFDYKLFFKKINKSNY